MREYIVVACWAFFDVWAYENPCKNVGIKEACCCAGWMKIAALERIH
jgi:hypothetical protein